MRRGTAAVVAVLSLSQAGSAAAHPGTAVRDPFAIAAADQAPFEGPVGRADCGPGSSPEPARQGQVTRADRDSGRSARGYWCNLERIGWFQGEGSTWVSASYGHCAYVATRFPSEARSPGVQVLDVSDPREPRRTAALTSPAMRGPWETLKVNERRGLLAAVSAGAPFGEGAAFFDIYDVATDCAHPRLLNSVSATELSAPANALGHEGGFSPDGRTYWSTFPFQGTITAIDVAEPTAPRIVYSGRTGAGNHGFGFSDDGRRLYLAHAGQNGSGSLLNPAADEVAAPNGLQIFDVSAVQERRPAPQIHEISRLFWADGAAGQHDIAITYGGRPHLVHVDELQSGAARILDISDESAPRAVSKLRLEIQMPGLEQERSGDTGRTGGFGYDAHYCEVDRRADPTRLACAYFESGVRVFDIRDPLRPRELAYYNPPAQAGKRGELRGSEHAMGNGDAMTTDWCSSPPRFAGDQLWVTCQDNGFMVLRFTNGVSPSPAQGRREDVGLPAAPRRCESRRSFVIRLRPGLRSARVHVNGRRVRVRRRGRRLRARIDLRGLPAGLVRVRVIGRTRSGRRVYDERTYRTCG